MSLSKKHKPEFTSHRCHSEQVEISLKEFSNIALRPLEGFLEWEGGVLHICLIFFSEIDTATWIKPKSHCSIRFSEASLLAFDSNDRKIGEKLVLGKKVG